MIPLLKEILPFLGALRADGSGQHDGFAVGRQHRRIRLPRETSRLERELAALKEALNGSDIESVKNATEKLVGVSQSFSQRLYEEAAKNNAGEGSVSSSDDDTIVDAEIVDEK